MKTAMTQAYLPASLLGEVRHNVERLRRDLAMLDMPDSEDVSWAEDYRFQAYEALNVKALQRMDSGVAEMLRALYKSLHVLSEGHAGFVTADEQALERAYRIALEAAIEMGEQLLQEKKYG
jgi:hypothetical protein